MTKYTKRNITKIESDFQEVTLYTDCDEYWDRFAHEYVNKEPVVSVIHDDYLLTTKEIAEKYDLSLALARDVKSEISQSKERYIDRITDILKHSIENRRIDISIGRDVYNYDDGDKLKDAHDKVFYSNIFDDMRYSSNETANIRYLIELLRFFRKIK